ncbi:flavodoxin domain-containing protein [Arabiibacter massiliensis]|uniref:flavodoxin domain-containing protein n=1 Tax=Arabiibacter massiliensis TaxID=1870985 RepID=UPI0009B9D190|nr:flavodoxin domain-containing protein [Arabiibacter massiliensis]
MTKAVVVYASQTGFTKRYAKWIAEELGCEAVPVERADAGKHDVVVFGGWFHAGGLVGKKWLARARAEHPETRFVAFAVGATPPEWADMVDEAMARELPSPEFDGVERFYLRGGFAYERLSLPNKLAMKLFFKMQEKQAADDPRAAEMLSGMRGGFDATDRAAIEPVVAAARG